MVEIQPTRKRTVLARLYFRCSNWHHIYLMHVNISSGLNSLPNSFPHSLFQISPAATAQSLPQPVHTALIPFYPFLFPPWLTLLSSFTLLYISEYTSAATGSSRFSSQRPIRFRKRSVTPYPIRCRKRPSSLPFSLSLLLPCALRRKAWAMHFEWVRIYIV